MPGIVAYQNGVGKNLVWRLRLKVDGQSCCSDECLEECSGATINVSESAVKLISQAVEARERYVESFTE